MCNVIEDASRDAIDTAGSGLTDINSIRDCLQVGCHWQ